jgi:alanyl-tRNA synthetase
VVAKLIEAGQSQDKQIAQLRKRLLLCELPTWAAQAQPLGTWRVLVRVLQEYDAASMRLAAQQLIQQPGLVVLLGVNDPAPQVCFARAKDVDLHMGQVLRTVLAAYGGRGGGEAHMAQGGGIRADQLEIVLQAAVGQLAGGQRA